MIRERLKAYLEPIDLFFRVFRQRQAVQQQELPTRLTRWLVVLAALTPVAAGVTLAASIVGA
jgi:hypothetical protein